MPGVDGIRYDIAFQNGLICVVGQANPLMNKNISEVNKNRMNGVSRLRKNTDMVMAKNMVASMNGNRNNVRASDGRKCGNLNIRGIRYNTKNELMMYIIR
mgnify:CR=1 FL=1